MVVCQYSQCQKTLQDEVDPGVGNRMAEFWNVRKLPLVRAIYKDLIRWRPIVPEDLLHRRAQHRSS